MGFYKFPSSVASVTMMLIVISPRTIPFRSGLGLDLLNGSEPDFETRARLSIAGKSESGEHYASTCFLMLDLRISFFSVEKWRMTYQAT